MEERWTGTRKLTKTTTATTTATINSYSINEAFNLLAQPLFRYLWTERRRTPVVTCYISHDQFLPSLSTTIHHLMCSSTNMHTYTHRDINSKCSISSMVLRLIILTHWWWPAPRKKHYTFSFYSSTCQVC